MSSNPFDMLRRVCLALPLCWVVSSVQAVSMTVYAVGDIGQCGHGAARTAALIEQDQAPVLAVGDLAYPRGSARDFARCYDPAWGRFKDRTYPVPGNHEYLTPGAAGYYDYFGPAAGERGKGWYGVNLGDWRVIGLNSNLYGDEAAVQIEWLRRDLAANRQRCVLAF